MWLVGLYCIICFCRYGIECVNYTTSDQLTTVLPNMTNDCSVNDCLTTSGFTVVTSNNLTASASEVSAVITLPVVALGALHLLCRLRVAWFELTALTMYQPCVSACMSLSFGTTTPAPFWSYSVPLLYLLMRNMIMLKSTSYVLIFSSSTRQYQTSAWTKLLPYLHVRQRKLFKTTQPFLIFNENIYDRLITAPIPSITTPSRPKTSVDIIRLLRLRSIKSNQIFIWIRQKPIHTDTHTHTQNTIYNKRRNYETVEKNSTSKWYAIQWNNKITGDASYVLITRCGNQFSPPQQLGLYTMGHN